jgi:replicative superfamily II helicase
MYLWRIKRKLQGNGRFVFLSAVAPNIKDVVGWLGSNPGSTVIEQRATRMRIGVYRIQGTGKKAVGKIEYSDGTAVNLIPEGVERLKGRGLIQLAASLGRAGPLLIVAKGKKECERLAKEMHDWLVAKHINDGLSDDLLHSDTVQRLDARLEREMYPEVTLRTLVASRIAYHHAGLPPSVRIGLEDAIRNELVDYVFATTTLAEGVNFPFSTVIVQSLALREAPEKGRPTRYHPVTPRIFWNIAGRAGRPGHDKEGQVLLFEPTLGLDKIAYVLGDYMNPQLSSINPVRSALADSICEIQEAIESKDLSSSDIESIRLPSRASKRVQGAINLLRVSLLHARASQF